MSPSTLRIAAFSGFAYIVLFLVSFPFALPAYDVSAQQLASDFVVDRNSVITGASIRSLSIILFLPFLAALARVARAEAGDAVGAIASGAGLLFASGALLANTLMAGLAGRIDPAASAETTKAIYGITLVLNTFLAGFALAGVAAATGYAILRAAPGTTGIPRRWAGWLSLAAGALFLAGAPFMANDGFFAPEGDARGFTFLVTWIWIASLSAAFLRQRRREVATARLETAALQSPA